MSFFCWLHFFTDKKNHGRGLHQILHWSFCFTNPPKQYVQNKFASLSVILLFPDFLRHIVSKQFDIIFCIFLGKFGPYPGRIRAVSEPYQIRAVSEPYQSRIRAVSGPYQGRIRAKTENFPFFSWGIGFFVFSVVLVVFLSSPHFYLRAVRQQKRKTCHCQTLNKFEHSKNVQVYQSLFKHMFFVSKKHQWFDQYFVQLFLHNPGEISSIFCPGLLFVQPCGARKISAFFSMLNVFKKRVLSETCVE